jgi:hypothetical protein
MYICRHIAVYNAQTLEGVVWCGGKNYKNLRKQDTCSAAVSNQYAGRFIFYVYRGL